MTTVTLTKRAYWGVVAAVWALGASGGFTLGVWATVQAIT